MKELILTKLSPVLDFYIKNLNKEIYLYIYIAIAIFFVLYSIFDRPILKYIELTLFVIFGFVPFLINFSGIIYFFLTDKS